MTPHSSKMKQIISPLVVSDLCPNYLSSSYRFIFPSTLLPTSQLLTRVTYQCWSESGLVSPAVSPSPQGQSPSPSPSPSGQSPSPSGVSPSPLDRVRVRVRVHWTRVRVRVRVQWVRVRVRVRESKKSQSESGLSLGS